MAKVPKKKSKSVKRAERRAKKRYLRNEKKRREIKSLIKEFKSLIEKKEVQKAKELLSQIYKKLDKAKKTHLFKAGKVDRLKSKMAKLLNSILS